MTAGLIVLTVLLLLCFLWLALSEIPAGWDGHNPLPYLIAFTPYLWIPFTILAIIGLISHQWVFLGCACLGIVASLLRKSSYWLNDLKAHNTGELLAQKLAERKLNSARTKHASTRTNPHGLAVEKTERLDSSHAGQFNVLTLNCRYGRANAKDIIRAVSSRDIAVLALQEMSPQLVKELEEEQINCLLPFHELGTPSEHDNGGFNGIYLRVEPTHSTPTGVPIPAADVPTVTLPVNANRSITFASAHAKSPMRGCKQWSEGIIGLGALAKQIQDGGNKDIAVVMGDLNSSICHPSFRKLLASGFHDSTLVEARGEHPTFPSWVRWPRLVLDHILYTDYLYATNVEALKVPGSDHLALTCTLHLTDLTQPVNAAARESWPESLPKVKERVKTSI